MKDISKKDDKTFVIALKEPYGLVADLMAKTATPMLYIMRKKEAETDPNQQITEYIGSGPFTYNRDETRMGSRYVYDRNPNYVLALRALDRHGGRARMSRSIASSTRTCRTRRPRCRR